MPKRKIPIGEVGFDKRYYHVCDTHNTYAERGRKKKSPSNGYKII